MKLISPKTALESLLGLKIAGEKATYPGIGCTYLEYGDQAVFKVTKEEGLVRLYARVE